MEIKEMTEIEDTVSNEVRLFIGGVPKNVTNEMIIARFAAVPEIKVKEASFISLHKSVCTGWVFIRAHC